VIAVDTNILVYAHREEMPGHLAAYARLKTLAEGAAPWGVPAFCLGEFLRVVTHPRVLSPASPLPLALDFLTALLASPTVRLLIPDERYFDLLRAQMEQAKATGNLVFHAQIAAVCVAHGATLLTADRDFSRFAISLERFDS